MQAKSNAATTLLAILAGIEAANPSENAKDFSNAELALEIAAYVSETYNDEAAGVEHIAYILANVAKDMTRKAVA